MTLTQIITRVQNICRNYGYRIWDATAVTEYINQGYTEFVKYSHCLRTDGKITITPNIATFTLPTGLLQANRYEFNGSIVPITTETMLDRHFGAGWRMSTGTSIQHVMQDKQGEGTIRIYPRISSSTYLGTLVTVVGTDGNDYYCIKSHTATADDTPITGENYPLYWKATGGTGEGAVWVLGTAYTEYYYLYVDYSYLPTALSIAAPTGEPLIASQYHHALAEYAVYMMQSQEVQSKKKPISAQHHLNTFWQNAASARGRTFNQFGSYESGQHMIIPNI